MAKSTCLLPVLLLLLLLGAGAALSSTISAASNFPNCTSSPLANNSVCDTSLSPTARARALISLLTLAEKINATMSTSPGVARLGLPAYQWWSEGLHGVAASPGIAFNPDNGSAFWAATSFPQPISLGAAFDDALVHDLATVVSTEARAFSNAGRAGLDFWTPNINPFRDPRWGRGQETPGEDPFHLSSYVKALISGLEGTAKGGTTHKKLLATCKHFAGYDMESWNGNYRYQFDAQISTQDMVEYYLPPFQACARDARVGAFMCSYNAVNGVPTCADGWLLNTVLREHWNWTATDSSSSSSSRNSSSSSRNSEDGGYWVTSDCDAVQNVYLPHRWAPSREAAAAQSLLAGTDLNCGTYYSHHLGGAYEQGLINDTHLDTALTRLYASLVTLGYFDPPADQPYRQLAWADVNTPASQHLAYRAAVSGTVLLKNTNATLPLTDLAGKKVAVLGDWADATTKMQGNYAGVAPYLHSPLHAAQQLLGTNNSVLFAAGPGYGDPTTNAWDAIWEAAAAADVLLYFGGVDNTVESEGMDRVSLEWTGGALDIIGELALLDKKPLVVVQMGGGQVDSSPLVGNPGVDALLWGGYPGQDGGTAILDVIVGKEAPAGRLPVTQYPARYVADTPMTNMALRAEEGGAFPGRTYRWFEGEAVFPFGYGLHYTSFAAQMALPGNGSSFEIATLTGNCSGVAYLDLCPFASVPVTITNTGGVTSDYAALLFLSGEFGPAPYPKKTLVAYTKAHNITDGGDVDVALDLNLGSLSRVDESGNRVLYPGRYTLTLDLEPGLAKVEFVLTGNEAVLDEWPAAPAGRKGVSPTEVGADYFVGGFGSTQEVLLGQ